MIKKGVFYLCLVFLCGCAYLSYIKGPFTDIPNFRKVDNILYRGGQPRAKGWEKIQSMGIKTVISLRGENEELLKEKELVENKGMHFYNIALSVYRQPAEKQVITFLEIILTESNQPVFLYCNNGRDRTGAMVALYRVVVYGWTIKNSYREARKLGFWPYHGEEAVLKKFIHQLKDKKLYFDKAKELLYEKNH